MATSIHSNTRVPQISLREMLAALPVLLAWRNSKGRVMPQHIKAAPGMGKTVIAETAAKAIAKMYPGEPVGFALHNLGILSPTDVPGYTLFETIQTDHGPEKVSVFTRPTVFHVMRVFMYAPDDERADSDGFIESEGDDLGQRIFVGATVFDKKLVHGITLLDEFMQADVETRKPAAPLLDEGRVATHYLPHTWVVWAASNRAQDASGTGRALGFLTNRECSYEATMTVDEVESYFNGEDALGTLEVLSTTMDPELDHRGRVIRDPANVDTRAHPAVLAFARQNADSLFAGVPSDPGKPFLTPRSLEAVSNLFDVMLRLGVSDDTGAMAEGMSFADSFIQRRESAPVEGVTGDSVVRWRVFQSLLEGTIGVEMGAQFLATLELFDEVPTLSEIVANPKACRVSSKADAQFICAHQIANGMTRKSADALMAYAKRLNPALYQNIVHNAATRDGDLLMAQSIRDWLNANPDSMVRMMQMRARAQGGGRKVS